jgi:hypothetical protein
VIPSGVSFRPRWAGRPTREVLAGRLSSERAPELVEAARAVNLVIAGDSHFDHRCRARGFVPPEGRRVSMRGQRSSSAFPPRGLRVACLRRWRTGVLCGERGRRAADLVDGETASTYRRAMSPRCGALERLLGDRELRRRMGEAGRRRAAEHFSWDAVTANGRLYARYAGKKPGLGGSASRNAARQRVVALAVGDERRERVRERLAAETLLKAKGGAGFPPPRWSSSQPRLAPTRRRGRAACRPSARPASVVPLRW